MQFPTNGRVIYRANICSLYTNRLGPLLTPQRYAILYRRFKNQSFHTCTSKKSSLLRTPEQTLLSFVQAPPKKSARIEAPRRTKWNKTNDFNPHPLYGGRRYCPQAPHNYPSVRRTASKHVRCLIPPTVSVQTRNLRIVGDSTEMNLHRRGAEIKPTPVHAAIDPFKGMIPNPFSRRLSGQTAL